LNESCVDRVGGARKMSRRAAIGVALQGSHCEFIEINLN
jgi:hypothetical protein